MGAFILCSLLLAVMVNTASSTSACSTINAAMTYKGKTYLFFGDNYVVVNTTTGSQISEGEDYEWGGLKGPINAAIDFRTREAAMFFRFPNFFSYMFRPGYGTWTSRMRESFISQPIDAATHYRGVAYFMSGCSAITWHHDLQMSTTVDLQRFGMPCDIDAAWEQGEDAILVKGNRYWVWGETVKGPLPFSNKFSLNSRTLCETSTAIPESSGPEWFWEKLGNSTERKESATLHWANDAAGYWSFRWATKQLPVQHFGHCGNETMRQHRRQHSDCDIIDAALTYRGKKYFFKGDQYITLADNNTEESIGDIAEWDGLTKGVRAAVQWGTLSAFFFKRWRYYTFMLDALHGPHNNEQWDAVINEGLDAAVIRDDRIVVFVACDYKEYDPKHNSWSQLFSLTSVGLPCNVDAAWEDDSGAAIILQNNQIWTWKATVTGPVPLSNVVTLTSWNLCQAETSNTQPESLSK